MGRRLSHRRGAGGAGGSRTAGRLSPAPLPRPGRDLRPACVALVFPPSDERYRPLLDRTVRTPFFDVEVPVLEHPAAAPDKGTGIAMVCTFGDLTDVVWWRDLHLPARVVLGRDGRFLPERPDGVPAAAYAPFAGLTVNAARGEIVRLLRESGDLVGEPRRVTHPVKFYEHG